MKDFFVRKYFSKVDKLIAAIGLLLLVWMFVIPTSRFIHPLGLVFAEREMQFTRAVPFGGVYASWWLEMSVGGFECYASKMSPLTSYQDNPRFPGQPLTARFGTPDRLGQCFELLQTLSNTEQFIVEQSHQVWVLGHIPLRPANIKWICRNRGRDCDIAERGGGFVEWILNS